MSRFQREIQKSQEQVETGKGKSKKKAGLYHGNSNEAELQKPRRGAGLLYCEVPGQHPERAH